MAIMKQSRFAPAYEFAKDPKMTNDIEIVEKIVTPNYIKIKLNTKKFSFIDDVDKWCCATGCGKRVNTTSFAFKTDAELTMFTLKWNPQNGQ